MLVFLIEKWQRSREVKMQQDVRNKEKRPWNNYRRQEEGFMDWWFHGFWWAQTIFVSWWVGEMMVPQYVSCQAWRRKHDGLGLFFSTHGDLYKWDAPWTKMVPTVFCRVMQYPLVWPRWSYSEMMTQHRSKLCQKCHRNKDGMLLHENMERPHK